MRVRSRKALFALEYVDLETAAQTDGAKWEAFQVKYLNNVHRFDLQVKARQIAWSFTAALDAVVDGIINPGGSYVFVSINQDEAKEKIRYARNILDAMADHVRPRLIQDSQTSLEFRNGSRLISHPCRPPRGKPRARIYYDEMAHYPEGMDREVYRAGLPATVKGDGYVRLGSSPLGARGLFWEIATEAMRAYPGFNGHRLRIPWWHVVALCNNVPEALEIAPSMPTEERVRLFGTSVLIEIYENMFLEDFEQEYECAWVDEATAWISWDVIKRNQDKDLVWWWAKNVRQARHQLDTVRHAVDSGQIEMSMAGGIDVGRKKDLTEFVILGLGEKVAPVRWVISLERTEYDDQEDLFVQIINDLPFTRVLVDETGIGSQLAENLRRKTGGKAQGVPFTQPNKEAWAVEARIRAERMQTPLPLERGLSYQIHSIKRKRTLTKHASFDTERNEKHHADKFWAWALAVFTSKSGLRSFISV